MLLVLCWLVGLSLSAQPLCTVQKYDESDGVPSSHVTQLLQDEQGFMWFATWNGLCRYDGYEFRTFKPAVGDGCHMKTDRIRNITLLPNKQMLCQVDEDYFMFDMGSYRFRDLTEEEQQQAGALKGKHLQSRSLQRKPFTWKDAYQTQWTLDGNGHLSYLDRHSGQQVDYPLAMNFRTLTFAMADNRGNLWALDYGSIYHFITDAQRTQRLPIEPHAEVKCLFADSQGRYWVTTKDDVAVRIYRSSDDLLLGYLGADGSIHSGYTCFGAAVYCMYEAKDGTLWLGTKPQGLFRLRPNTSTSFKIDHFTDIPHKDIYHIAEDQQGRLWIASLGGGIFYSSSPKEEHPRFIVPRHYPEAGQRARYLLITPDNTLLVATSNGLLVSQLKVQADDMHFLLHQREPDRKESLSCSATMDVVQDRQGRFFVSTESGGVNQIKNSNLLDSVLTFQHLREQFHVQPNDIVQSLTVNDEGGLTAVGSHLITLLDSTLQGRVLDAGDLNADYRFSEAHPLALRDGRWLFGLTDGAFVTTTQQMNLRAYSPRMVLTGISIQGASDNWAVVADTLMLRPDERSFTLHFAALDYKSAERISYAFRLMGDSQRDTIQWNYIGRNRSVTLLDLEPGEYLLEVRSTNADGEWLDNQRQLTIIVKPTFWESTIGQLLVVLLLVAILAAIAYTYLYIRRIKRQQHETLEKYLALIEANKEQTSITHHLSPNTLRPSSTTQELDPTLQRVMQFIEDNISNSDASVGDMASAAATSRSGLQRKLKQAMGITPQDLLREARIKRACQLLRQTDKNVSEVAYACGFSDPKYFSRSFKQSTGMSPTEYKSAS
jgi:AraC-like DNA-binding protein/ligand-binding sensor domain-containing protein